METATAGPGGRSRIRYSMPADTPPTDTTPPVEPPASPTRAQPESPTPDTERETSSDLPDEPGLDEAPASAADPEERETADETAVPPVSDATDTDGGPDAPAAEPAEPDPVEEVARLQAELAETTARYDDLLLRERAELDNFKRRMQRDKIEAVRFAAEPLLRDVLPVVDNLERAVEHARDAEESSALVEGVEMVLRSLSDVLEKHGVTRVAACGAPFDPGVHQAVAHVEDSAAEPNTVLDEHQSGYRFHDRLLRPAMVSVAKAPAEPQPDDGEKSA